MADLPLLGKLAPKLLKGLPALGKYTLHLPASPPAANYSLALKHLGHMANDTLGDCTCAAAGHLIQTWTSQTQPAEVIVSDDAIINFYSKACGYVIGDPNTDQGGVETDVLKYWYLNGLGGHPLAGFASIRPGNRASIRDSIYLFGGCYIGVQLPIAAQSGAWDVSPDSALTGDNAPGSWGGHAVCLVAYDQDSVTCITWGALKTMSWAWIDAYCDEAYAVLSKDWITAAGTAPPGFDFSTLSADMQAIRGS